MKKIVLLIITLLSFLQNFASHISGGELFYEYIGQGSSAGRGRYKITMRLFRDCHPSDPSAQALDNEAVVIGIYHNADLRLDTSVRLSLITPIPTISLNTSAIPCLINAPEVCFQVGVFTGEADLPISPDGYIVSWIRCCRRNNIANLSISAGIGATFTTTIPGTIILPSGHNSSPQFAIKDTALVCQNKNFILDFGASDADNDSLSFSFCDAFSGGTVLDPNPGSTVVPPKLTLTPLPYKSPFSGASPLGRQVSINPNTGKITGVAPAAGSYVINVCVTEWRNGKAINVHHKDFILEVGNCDFTAAEPLPVSGAWCKDSVVHFSNSSNSSTIQSYYWDFGVPGATSDEATPDYKYADTGVYTIKLRVEGAAGCVDEATTTIGFYPGFKTDFEISGSCFQTPFTFKDASTTGNNGTINSWVWNFGNTSDVSGISSIQNPTYRYTDSGTKSVKLIVTSTKGCIDSITKPVEVRNVAALKLPFTDTLICSIDTLALHAVGTGVFTWSPANNIINATSSDPSVFPNQTTTYYVSVTDEGGCINTDSVRISVLDSITVNAGDDLSLCRADSITLTAESAGLQYHWSPSAGLNNSNASSTVAAPDTTTTYVVTANLGNCTAEDAVRVKVTPKPIASAGPDVTVCYGDTAHLAAAATGASFTWSTQNSLENYNTLTPFAHPQSTTSYILTVADTLGCTKPSRDTVLVTVIPQVKAFAGNDTVITANQPLQLNATGGNIYLWSPSSGMNNTMIANPVVILSAAYDSITYKVRVSDGECFAEDELKVKIFKTGPDIFIPTAFTPNSDRKNDILKPIPVGIKTFNYFRIYNRWGQMVYSTTTVNNGWDGSFGGKEQATGTYVFTAQATDYLGKQIFRKGTVVLIR